jgi:hypothetical protein
LELWTDHAHAEVRLQSLAAGGPPPCLSTGALGMLVPVRYILRLSYHVTRSSDMDFASVAFSTIIMGKERKKRLEDRCRKTNLQVINGLTCLRSWKSAAGRLGCCAQPIARSGPWNSSQPGRQQGLQPRLTPSTTTTTTRFLVRRT